MMKNLLGTCIFLLAFWNLILSGNVQAIPLDHGEESDLFSLGDIDLSENEDVKQKVDISYQNDDGFKKEIKEKLDEHHKSNGVLFDKILLVNQIHKRWKNKYEESKRNLKETPDDIIIENNLKNDEDYFEGDISLDKVDKKLLNKSSTEDAEIRRKRNAVHARKKIWTSREVPFIIDSTLSNKARTMIGKAIQIVNAKTCIRWVSYVASRHRNYVQFTKQVGCHSRIGRSYWTTGPQILSIGEGCEWVGTVLHEMTHAMGFFHEQSRDDRDKFIEVVWQNIPVSYQDQFEKYSHGTIDKMGIDYDYQSLMHYGSTAFGGGKVTIKAIDNTKTIGNTAETFTRLDLIELNALYDCKTRKSGATAFSSWSRWSECDKSCYKERQRFCFYENKALCPGSNTYGIQSQKIKCAANECPAPINGNWGPWSSWGPCSKTCDEGKRQRTRQCNKPVPSTGGKFCIGESRDIGVCLNRRCNIGPYDVDFENGWGMWFSDSTAVLRWLLNRGPVKTLHTGPSGDHTLRGQGNYIYVESSRPRVKGNSARLVSKLLNFPKPRCLSFYYSMYGSVIGSLKLYVVPQGGKWVEVFSRSGNQGQAWHNADVTLDYRGRIQLVFEAILGGTGTSDIALDDIFIDEDACPGYVAPTTGSTTCEDHDKRCSSWAKSGECTKNPTFMHKKCKQSCGLCPTTKPAVCEDFDEIKCGEMARKGHCKTKPDKMARKCRASCGKCPDKPCKDDDSYRDKCKKWAIDGECFKSKTFMFKSCKESCGICNGCADMEKGCVIWAAKGECQKNPKYMKAKCKASCGLCGDCEDAYALDKIQCGIWASGEGCYKNYAYMMTMCKKSCTGCTAPCNDNNAECPKWAKEKECEKNPAWMGENCKKSCGKC